MSGKNYGPSVSGYLDPTGRAWETVIFQAGKPVLDKEMNLVEDIAFRPLPSGWISPDFTAAAAGNLGAIFTAGLAGNIATSPPMMASLNGWNLRVVNTNANGSNQLTFPPAPIAAGDKRTDIVVLEVWRRLLSASPDATGKSAAGLIWREGNVKVAPADDLVLNFPDDILDAMVGAESTKRVQIQYRLRVIANVDIFAYPYGLNDPTVVANTVPAAPAAPDGLASIYNYVNASPNGDGGMWVAGDGSPAAALALGTVDGFMYAMPLMAVFRRNSAPFDKNTNHNGGAASLGPSDRPDGLFNDIIVTDDIVDLRTGANVWDYSELLEKNFTYLLDNALRSEWETTVIGGGVAGHTPFYACEIGVLPGDGTTTGDTPGADFIAQFDAARRDFSDRPIFETITVAIPAPGGGWVASGSVPVDPTSLPIHPYAAFNWAARAPGQVMWTDVTRAYWGGGAGLVTVDDAMPYIDYVLGLGTLPITPLTLTMGAITPLGLTNETLYIDIVVAYPSGEGLTRTPVSDFGLKSFMVNNPAQLPNAAPFWCDPAQLQVDVASGITYLINPYTAFDYTHRETRLVYRTSSLTFTQAADTTGPSVTIQLPERAQDPILNVSKQTGGVGPFNPVAAPVSLSLDGRTVTVAPGDASAPTDVWQVDYIAIRPMPQNDEQVTIFFGARAPQTARTDLLGGLGPQSITVLPRHILKNLYVITAGSGAVDEGYPFPQAYVQTGGIFPSLADTYTGEHELQSGADISTATFSATTGLLSLPTNIDYTPNPDAVTFLRASTDFDAEGRTFYKEVPSGYMPNAFAQDLSDQRRHKVVMPFLAELTSDSKLGVTGQLVLFLLTRWAKNDETNGVFFDTDLNVSTTSASVFRLRNTLLNSKRA